MKVNNPLKIQGRKLLEEYLSKSYYQRNGSNKEIIDNHNKKYGDTAYLVNNPYLFNVKVKYK